MTQFEYTVLQMRNAQRDYFRTRCMDALRESKALEKQVDEMLEEMQNPQPMLPFAKETER